MSHLWSKTLDGSHFYNNDVFIIYTLSKNIFEATPHICIYIYITKCKMKNRNSHIFPCPSRSYCGLPGVHFLLPLWRLQTCRPGIVRRALSGPNSPFQPSLFITPVQVLSLLPNSSAWISLNIHPGIFYLSRGSQPLTRHTFYSPTHCNIISVKIQRRLCCWLKQFRIGCVLIGSSF